MSDLEGKRILVLDDEPLIVMLLEDILADLGCAVVGPALDVAEAERLARTSAIDAAILDVNVHDRTSRSVAELLKARGIPFVIATGYDGDGVMPGANGTLHKPYGQNEVKAALLGLLG